MCKKYDKLEERKFVQVNGDELKDRRKKVM
jgi:hypothetical protein